MKMCKLKITIVLYIYFIEFNKSHLYFKLNYNLMLRTIFIMSIILSSAIILPLTKTMPSLVKGEAHNFLALYLSKILGAKWWQWALEIPKPINPLIDANPCNVNQHGYFFFLAGVFIPVPSTATSGTSESSDIFQTRDAGDSSDTTVSSDTSGHIERTCTIPKRRKPSSSLSIMLSKHSVLNHQITVQQPFRKR